MIYNRLAAAAAVGLVGGAFLLGSPAQATDGYYPDAGWQVRQIAIGDTDWSPAAASTIVDATTVDLTKPDGTTGTSIETADLGFSVQAGDAIAVKYQLLDGATLNAEAVRLFYYNSASADTLLTAPTAFAAADGSGTLVALVAADATIGTLGMVYDASNASAGTVRFSDLTVADTPVLFTAPVPEPTEEPARTTEPTGTPAPTPEGNAGEELPATGSDWVLPLVGGAFAVVGAVLVYSVRRARRVTFTAE